MNSFDNDFEIILNCGMEMFPIKPPTSYNSLVEIAKGKYDLTIVNKILYTDVDDGENIKIGSDLDYLNFLDFIEKKKLKEIEVIIKSDESKSLRKKSIRKGSIIKSTKRTTYDDDCVNDHFDCDYESDLRNKKYLMEFGAWTNQSKNKNEVRRIDYIKQKKLMQKEEQGIKDNSEDEDSDSFNDNSRKRVLKSNKKNVSEREEVIVENTKNGKKGKNKNK